MLKKQGEAVITVRRFASGANGSSLGKRGQGAVGEFAQLNQRRIELPLPVCDGSKDEFADHDMEVIEVVLSSGLIDGVSTSLRSLFSQLQSEQKFTRKYAAKRHEVSGMPVATQVAAP